MDRSTPETHPLFLAPHVDAISIGGEDHKTGQAQDGGDGTVINGPAVTSLEPVEERRRAG